MTNSPDLENLALRAVAAAGGALSEDELTLRVRGLRMSTVPIAVEKGLMRRTKVGKRVYITAKGTARLAAVEGRD